MRIVMQILATGLGCIGLFITPLGAGILIGSGQMPVLQGLGTIGSGILLGSLCVYYLRHGQMKTPEPHPAFDYGPVPVSPGMRELGKGAEKRLFALMQLTAPMLGLATWWAYVQFGITVKLSTIVSMLFAVLAIAPLHEQIHRLAIPVACRHRARTGFDPSRGVFFCTWAGDVTKAQWIRIALAPFLLLSILPFGVNVTIWPNEWLAGAVIVHTSMCIGDLIHSAWIASPFVPRGRIYQHGTYTFVERRQ